MADGTSKGPIASLSLAPGVTSIQYNPFELCFKKTVSLEALQLNCLPNSAGKLPRAGLEPALTFSTSLAFWHRNRCQTTALQGSAMRWAWWSLPFCLLLAHLRCLEARVTDASVLKDSRQTILLDEAFGCSTSRSEKVLASVLHFWLYSLWRTVREDDN